MRIFINDRPVDASDGADVAGALIAADPGLAPRLADGSAHVTDGCGIRVELDSPLAAGSILRVIVSARRRDQPDADS
ncbi:MAG: hypothetical protein ABI836_10665 [Gemmatimonadota bacterium]